MANEGQTSRGIQPQQVYLEVSQPPRGRGGEIKAILAQWNFIFGHGRGTPRVYPAIVDAAF